MRHVHQLLRVVGCVLVMVLSPWARCEVPGGGEEADHQALRELKAVFEEAASGNKLELLQPYMHHPFSVVTYTNREFTEFQAFKAQWQKTRDEIVGDGVYQVVLRPERSEIYGDIAITHGDSDNVLVTSNGTRYEFNSRWTAVCRKVAGQWKIVRAHSSLDPFGNPMLRGRVRRYLFAVGAGAAVAGLLLGTLLVLAIQWFRGQARGIVRAG